MTVTRNKRTTSHELKPQIPAPPKRRVKKPAEEQLEPTSIAAIKKVMQDEVTKQFLDLSKQLNLAQKQNIYLASVVGKLLHAIAEIQTWHSLATNSNHGSARTTLNELASNVDMALQPIVNSIMQDPLQRTNGTVYDLVINDTANFRRSMMPGNTERQYDAGDNICTSIVGEPLRETIRDLLAESGDSRILTRSSEMEGED